MSGHVAILGAGTMGAGIARLLAAAGTPVVLADADEATAARAARVVQAKVADGPGADVTAAPDAAAAVAGAHLVVEAVPERLALKREVLQGGFRALGPDALLVTNTSSLSIDALAEGLDGARFAGLHFFNPPHAMRLVEVVRGGATSPATIDRLLALVRSWDREPIVVRDSPGFATSRLGVLLGVEAARMVEEEVATAAEIDAALELGYGHPMGPLRLTDLVGVDVRCAIAEHLARELGPRFEPPAIMRAMLAEGRLGRKSGAGFYDWPTEQRRAA